MIRPDRPEWKETAMAITSINSTAKKAVVAALLLTPLLLAQPPKDIEGWREAKWGMTKDQVLQAFPGEAKQGPPIKFKRGFIDGIVSIDKFVVSDLNTRALFQFNRDSGCLQRILLEPSGGTAALFSEWYKRMLPLLIEKYGQPTVRSEPRALNGNVNESVVWSFPSTTIELVTYGQLFTTRIEFRQGGSKNNPL
jgi:hypothetical protein